MKTKKDMKDTLRYKHMVARLAGLKPPQKKEALLKEIAEGKQWRIDAALEATRPAEWAENDRAETLNWAAMFGRLQTVQKIARLFGYAEDGNAKAPEPLQAAYRTALLHGHYRTARALAGFGARPDAPAAQEPAAEKPAVVAPEPKEEPQPQPLPAVTDEQLRKTPFHTSFDMHQLPVLKDAWRVADVDPALKAALGLNGSVRRTAEGLDLSLSNGHTIQWNANLNGTEFIGNREKNPDFDSDDARAAVAASKSRGWATINVHGEKHQKECLWLEAQRQGLRVANFKPDPDSEVRKIWAKEQAAQKAKPKPPGIAA